MLDINNLGEMKLHYRICIFLGYWVAKYPEHVLDLYGTLQNDSRGHLGVLLWWFFQTPSRAQWIAQVPLIDYKMVSTHKSCCYCSISWESVEEQPTQTVFPTELTIIVLCKWHISLCRWKLVRNKEIVFLIIIQIDFMKIYSFIICL